MRHLLQRLVRASVIQSRAAHYTLQSSTWPPNQTLSPHAGQSSPARIKLQTLQPVAKQQHSSSKGQWLPLSEPDMQPQSEQQHQSSKGPWLLQADFQGVAGTTVTQHLCSSPVSSQHMSKLQLPLQSETTQQMQVGGHEHVWQPASSQHPASELQLVKPDGQQVTAELQLSGVPYGSYQQAGVGPAETAQVQAGKAAQEDRQEADDFQRTAVLAQNSAGVQGVELTSGMLSQRPEMPQYGVQGQDTWQSQNALIRAVLHQQHMLAASLQQMQHDMHAMQQAITSELHVLKGPSVGKVRLKPL